MCAGCTVGVIASPWGHFKLSGNISLVTAWKNGMEKGATVITWIEPREIAKHSKAQAPPSPHLHIQEVNGAEAEKLLLSKNQCGNQSTSSSLLENQDRKHI